MDSLEKKWEVYAIKYAERNDRTRNDSFIFDDVHAFFMVIFTGKRSFTVEKLK